MSPLSPDDEARARQLANLQSGEHADNLTPGAGQERAALANTRHGAYSAALLANVEAEVAELRDALGEAAPVREPDGTVPSADLVTLEVAARALKRYRHLSTWLDLHGRIAEDTGEVKPAAKLELDAERRLTSALETLGMSPSSRAKLGVSLAKVATLEDELRAGREARERAEARRRAADAEATAEDDGGAAA